MGHLDSQALVDKGHCTGGGWHVDDVLNLMSCRHGDEIMAAGAVPMECYSSCDIG